MDIQTLASTATALVAASLLPATQVISACPYTWERNLTLGSTGSDVKALQIFLNSDPETKILSGKGSAGLESDYFGVATKAAVAKFQAKYSSEIFTTLTTAPTGYLGKATRAKLNDLCKPPSSPSIMMQGASTSMRMFGTTSSSTVLEGNERPVLNLHASTSTPTVTLQINADDMSGWNLNIRTSNFVFSPQSVGQDYMANHGHAHVLVDGIQVGRAYSDWYYIPHLSIGTHVITVALETNDHRDFAVDGIQISAEVKVVVSN